MKFTKKPVTIDAWQYDATGVPLPGWLGAATKSGDVVFVDEWTDGTVGHPAYVKIHTPEGDMTASIGDWIIRGVEGEIYPCKPSVFEKTYIASGVGTLSDQLNDGAVIEPMLQFFAFNHLPTHLQHISMCFASLAVGLVLDLPRNPERTVALRKLLEAKDCAVRASIYKSPAAANSPPQAAENSPAIGTPPVEGPAADVPLSTADSTAKPENGLLSDASDSGEVSSPDVAVSPVTEVTSDTEFAGHPELLKETPPLDAVSDIVAGIDVCCVEKEAAPKDAVSVLLAEPRALYDHIINPANDKLSVCALDAPGCGGASHSYVIDGFNTASNVSAVTPHGKPITMRSTKLLFQNGPIGEVGINGITHEALLAILIDRLKGFQEGPFAGSFNSAALMHCKQALGMLRMRTEERMKRGVEGTHKE